ncbi:hypothetical protein HS9_01392 [Bacillus velezensis]|nr:hypothetical protein HS9_01392 [Bacillus velezensis]
MFFNKARWSGGRKRPDRILPANEAGPRAGRDFPAGGLSFSIRTELFHPELVSSFLYIFMMLISIFSVLL